MNKIRHLRTSSLRWYFINQTADWFIWTITVRLIDNVNTPQLQHYSWGPLPSGTTAIACDASKKKRKKRRRCCVCCSYLSTSTGAPSAAYCVATDSSCEPGLQQLLSPGVQAVQLLHGAWHEGIDTVTLDAYITARKPWWQERLSPEIFFLRLNYPERNKNER